MCRNGVRVDWHGHPDSGVFSTVSGVVGEWDVGWSQPSGSRYSRYGELYGILLFVRIVYGNVQSTDSKYSRCSSN